ncbi:MAG: hypothetical protein IKH22_01880 [Prevotella sp.]|nr:hypothetical protein [Prevotella sp.]
MKKILFTLLVSLLSVGAYSQSVADLDRDPSFKGITIGAPISKYSDILSFSHTSKGKNVYRVRESRYLSIFNNRMDDMIVVESNGKVYAIQLTKTYPADASGACVFNAKELLSWYSSLRAKYGNNSFSLDDMSGTPSVCGMRWKANSVVLDIVYLFYGTFGDEKPKLQYYLYQREDDY